MLKAIKWLALTAACFMVGITFYCSIASAQESIIRRAAPYGNGATHNFAGFPSVENKVQTNGTVYLMGFGDSLVTGQLFYPISSYFAQTYGFAGFNGTAGSSYGNISWVSTNVGATSVTLDFTAWFDGYWNVPNAAAIAFFATNSTVTGVLGINANVIAVDYIAENGAGTFKIQTNAAPGGAWGDFQTGINANNGGTRTGVALRYTNSFIANTMIRIVGTAVGTTKIISCGLYSYPNKGVIIDMLAQGSLGINQFTQVPTNITGPILLARNPNLIVSKWLDSSAVMSTTLPVFNTFVSSYVPNSDFLWVACNPTIGVGGTSDPSDIPVQNAVMYQNAIKMRQNYFDGYTIFGSTNVAVGNGFLSAATDPHPTVQGDLFTANAIQNWAGWFSADNKQYGQLYFTYGANDTATLTNAWLRSEAQNGSPGITIGWDAIRQDTGMWINSPRIAINYSDRTFNPPELFSVFNGDIGVYANGNFKALNGALYNLIIGTKAYPAQHTVFVMTANGSSTNTTTTTNTLWGTGSGSRILDASWFTVGRCLEAELEGDYWSSATPGNTRFLVMLNTTSATNIAAQSLFATPGTVLAGDFFRLKTKTVCRTTGVGGTVATSGSLEFYNAGAATVRYFTNQVITVDTTGQLTFDFASTNGATADSFLAKNGLLNLK